MKGVALALGSVAALALGAVARSRAGSSSRHDLPDPHGILLNPRDPGSRGRVRRKIRELGGGRAKIDLVAEVVPVGERLTTGEIYATRVDNLSLLSIEAQAAIQRLDDRRGASISRAYVVHAADVGPHGRGWGQVLYRAMAMAAAEEDAVLVSHACVPSGITSNAAENMWEKLGRSILVERVERTEDEEELYDGPCFVAWGAPAGSFARAGSRAPLPIRRRPTLITAPPVLIERALARHDEDFVIARNSWTAIDIGDLCNWLGWEVGPRVKDEHRLPLKAVLNVRQELFRTFGNLPDPLPVYRGILSDPDRDVGKHGAVASARVDAGDPGRHWTLDLEVAQAFANSTHEAQIAYYEDEDLTRLGPGRILHGHVALRNVDWRETFDRFCRFSLGDEWDHQGDATRAERQVYVPGRVEVTKVATVPVVCPASCTGGSRSLAHPVAPYFRQSAQKIRVYRGTRGACGLCPDARGVTYWTDDPAVADRYADHKSGRVVHAGHLYLHNPYVLETDAAARQLASWLDAARGIRRDLDDDPWWHDYFRVVDQEGVPRVLAARGYDGIRFMEDGLWREHSWGIRVDSESPKVHVIETTTPRVAYFGFVLTDAEAQGFLDANPHPWGSMT